MKIGARYSHKNGEDFIKNNHPGVIKEIEEIIDLIDAEKCRKKKPEKTEKIRAKRIGVEKFYSPRYLNVLFEWHLYQRGWDIKPRVREHARGGYREMDMLKDKVGIEVQIGKYAFLTYDIIAKMVIYKNLGLIDCGIELCPMASMLPHMSTGIGCIEQVVWDLKHRGEADIDVPVLVIGFEANHFHDSEKGEQSSSFGDDAYDIQTSRFKGFTTNELIQLDELGIDASN